jgi:hypothetical protein
MQKVTKARTFLGVGKISNIPGVEQKNDDKKSGMESNAIVMASK